MELKNQTLPPCNTTAFQAELARLCRGHNLELRITWAPALTVAKIIGINGRPVLRQYAKYPLVGNHVKASVVGHRFMRQVDGAMVQTGYQKSGSVVVGPVAPTDIAEPDYESISFSIHLFVIEEKRPDEYARRVWARKRQLALDDIGIDPYGDFPAEGVWDWLADIGEHRDGCCYLAFTSGVRCAGLYRPPDQRDLDGIARKIQERQTRSQYAYREEQLALDMQRGQSDYEQKITDDAMAEAREIQRTAVRSITKPAIYLDSSKRKTH